MHYLRITSCALILVILFSSAGQAAGKKKSHYRGCPAGMTFAPDIIKEVPWARSVWAFPGMGYRPPKEWKCK
jgi:hypothetical protein